MKNSLDLYLKLGNQFFFFIFASESISKVYIIPSYATFNSNGSLKYLGPYSFLQYYILKQTYKLVDHPIIIKHRDLVVKRLIDKNFINDLKIIFDIFKILFNNELSNFYRSENISDYVRYSVPFFYDFNEFYYLLKSVRKLFCINFLDPKTPYFINHYRFLNDLFRYFGVKVEFIDFSDFFYKFFRAYLSIYFAEYNSFLWYRNDYGFFAYKRLQFNKRILRELILKKFMDEDKSIAFLDLEGIVNDFLKNSFRWDVGDSIRKSFYSSFLSDLRDFFINLEPAIIEDIYSFLEKPNNVKFFNSVVSYEDNFGEMIISGFKDVLIK